MDGDTVMIVVGTAVATAALCVAVGRLIACRVLVRYEQACGDYESLVYHRIANPLTVIGGIAETLLDEGLELDSTTSRHLLETVAEQSRRIEAATIGTTVELGPEERLLCATVRRVVCGSPRDRRRVRRAGRCERARPAVISVVRGVSRGPLAAD